MNVLGHNRGWDAGGPVVLMSDWWVREHWGRAFEIVDIAPQFQNYSWAVMRKRDVELTTEELECPSDDPREHAAVRHNLRQVQRELADELAFQDQLHQQTIAAYQERIGEYEDRLRAIENSASWKLTRPLRRAKRGLQRNGTPG